MRIYFDSMAHPKRLSKRLSAETGRALHPSQTAVARMFGHSDWHALEASVDDAHLHKISLPDRLCAPNVVESRYVFQCHVLQREFDLGLAEAAEIVVKL